MLKKLGKFIGLGLLILLITVVSMQRGFFMGVQRGFQNQFYDYDAASSEIVVVAIDEKSLSDEGLGPLTQWKRADYAQVIEQLSEAGASAIGLDITLPDSSPHGPEDDELLWAAVEKGENVVLAARYFFDNGEQQMEWPNASLKEAPIGLINVALDDDGFVRRLPVSIHSDRGEVDAFSVQLAKQQGAKIPIPVTTEQGIPLMNINYFAAPYGFQHISFVNVLEGNFVDKRGNKVDFEGKTALIGPTAVDLQDDYLSPVSQGVRMPGVEIHANALQTILEGKFLIDQSALSLWLILLGLLIFNLIAFSFLKLRTALLLVAVESLGILIAGIVGYEFLILMNVVYPLLVATLSFVGAFLLRFLLEQKDRKFIEGAFGHYVNKNVVEAIVKDSKKLELGGSKKTITAFFSDIANFTSISEKMEPSELTTFLNEYLEAMTTIILKHGGTLDKYEGDAIMAFWGAPLDSEDHAQKACLAALEQQEKLSELRQKWSAEGKPEIHVRMGLNTGEAVVGNMGSKDRFDYTAMGDSVNLASRLEGINKHYGTSLLISENTHQAVQGDLQAREVDRIRVKGKTESVTIYELTENDSPDFAEALELYRNRQFEEAKQSFAGLSDDDVAKVFVKRCDTFIKNPPVNDWDGVWNFEVK